MSAEVSKDKVLSGYAYVAAYMRVADSPEDRKLCKILISKPQLCDHVKRICIKCRYMWEWDYDIQWHRTAGGRELEEARGAEPAAANLT